MKAREIRGPVRRLVVMVLLLDPVSEQIPDAAAQCGSCGTISDVGIVAGGAAGPFVTPTRVVQGANVQVTYTACNGGPNDMTCHGNVVRIGYTTTSIPPGSGLGCAQNWARTAFTTLAIDVWPLNTPFTCGALVPRTKTLSTAPIPPGTYYVLVEMAMNDPNRDNDRKTATAMLTVDPACTAPGMPTLSSPAKGVLRISQPVSFSWGASSGTPPITYRLQVALDSEFTILVLDVANLNPTTYGPTALGPGTHYYWRVQAANACGASWSLPFNFTTASSIFDAFNYSYPTPGCSPGYCSPSPNNLWRKLYGSRMTPQVQFEPWNVATSADLGRPGTNLFLIVPAGLPARGGQIESTTDYAFGSYRSMIRAPDAAQQPDGTVVAVFSANTEHEIDVELLSREQATGSGKVWFVLHNLQNGLSVRRRFLQQDLPYNPGQDHHVVGYDWYADRIEFCIDGAKTFVVRAGDPSSCPGPQCPGNPGTSEPMQISQRPATLILNHWTGNPNWGGGPPGQPGQVREARVDWTSYVPLALGAVLRAENTTVRLSGDTIPFTLNGGAGLAGDPWLMIGGLSFTPGQTRTGLSGSCPGLTPWTTGPHVAVNLIPLLTYFFLPPLGNLDFTGSSTTTLVVPNVSQAPIVGEDLYVGFVTFGARPFASNPVRLTIVP